MVFSSIEFLFLFLPSVLLLNFIIGGRYRNYILILLNLVFYAVGEKRFIWIILFSILFNYLFARIVESNKDKQHKAKMLISVAVTVNLLLLGIFKYLNFIVKNLNTIFAGFDFTIPDPGVHLPIGISFFTFQAMSYIIDVYRGEVKAQKKISIIALFITLFPHLIAGPIVRYKHIEKELESRVITLDAFEKGIIRFITGLGKKILIANNLALVADGVFNTKIEYLSTPYAWIGIIAYTLQIYFDFSGYSDMAIGLARILGITFQENFNYPYLSKSVKEFWRRWHISLSTWFRDYVYISLGGNRKGPYRTYVNLFIVFFLTGLWHGAEWTFVAWGLYHGFFLIIERMGFNRIITKLRIGNVYSLAVIMTGWVFFRSADISYACGYIKLLYSFNFNVYVSYEAFRYISKEFYIFLFSGILLSTPVVPFLKNKFSSIQTGKLIYRFTVYSNTLLIFFLCIVYLAKGSYNPFIYFRF